MNVTPYSKISPSITVIIPNWNSQNWLPGCLDGLRAQTFRDFQVLLVDNGSSDSSVDFVKQHYPEVDIIAFSKNRGFAKAVNAGIKHSQSEYVALLNVDTVPQPDWLGNLLDVMKQRRARQKLLTRSHRMKRSQ